MPYEDEIPPWAEQWQPPPQLNELSGKVIGAAMEVHDKLGPGLPEEAYQRALEMEFTARGNPFQPQFRVEIRYKGAVVCQGRIDFLSDGQLILEIKSIDRSPRSTRSRFWRTCGRRICTWAF